jgi:hypothetical protein
MVQKRGCSRVQAVLRAPTDVGLLAAVSDAKTAGDAKVAPLTATTLCDANGELMCARLLASEGYVPSRRVEPSLTEQHNDAFELWIKKLS